MPDQDADDRAVRAVVDRFFAAFVSGPEAAARAEDLRAVLLPEALLVSAAGAGLTTYDVESFIAPRVALLGSGALSDFREWVESARVDRFGEIAQVWCTYAKSWRQDGEPRTGSGAKSLQLVRTAGGWRISAVVWDDA
ncbi:nuclear transport factor 2 family protein [Nocardioides nitrophenolicus]|uniref:nuclear transport factor 2 family protein n=1 Tax=Nocardioides nitrophenolicus TaxID=60489 RepID=UPI001EF98495|nr:nuclear transport factor 2 family protein [Nocardioides nitrophenolicus]MBM7520239.1 hypothetical protein [Nocardioides nitrophenolicus]